jgi:hypothetical protein
MPQQMRQEIAAAGVGQNCQCLKNEVMLFPDVKVFQMRPILLAAKRCFVSSAILRASFSALILAALSALLSPFAGSAAAAVCGGAITLVIATKDVSRNISLRLTQDCLLPYTPIKRGEPR